MKNWERYAEREIECKMAHIRSAVIKSWKRFAEKGDCGYIYCNTCPFKGEGCTCAKQYITPASAKEFMQRLNEEAE